MKQNSLLHILFALLIGLGLGLAYSWLLSPVTYVDAAPAILREDFKDQYRVVIAAAYESAHDLERARSRLELLGDINPIGELSAQAQRMVASGVSLEEVQPLAQLATDLQQGFVNIPATATDFIPVSAADTEEIETPIEEIFPTETETTPEVIISSPTISFEQTALTPIQQTNTPRPTFTPPPPPGNPFTLVGQDTLCEPDSQGLMQFILMDSRRREIAGIKIIVTWSEGEDSFFTGFKPELGNGYADFAMEADVVYNVRVVEGGAFVPNISAPICTDPNGSNYTGGLLLTFQRP